MYPFRLEPIYKEYSWGGHRIKDRFQRTTIPDGKVAESWEIVDHENDANLIINGPFAGKSLREIIAACPVGFFETGINPLDRSGRFPLMLKYINAEEQASVQVYPRSGQAKVWIVVDAAPEGVLYLGFNRPYPQSDVASAAREGRLESLLHKIHPKVGDCYRIEPGTVHSLGNGILVAEVQRTGDTPFCLFNWNKKETERNEPPPRIDQALQAIDSQQGAVFSQKPTPTEYRNCQRLVTSEEFLLNRWSFDEMAVWASDNRFHIWSVLQGNATAVFHLGRRGTPENMSGRQSDPIAMERLKRGDTLLIPVSCRSIQWTNDGDEPVVLLDAYEVKK